MLIAALIPAFIINVYVLTNSIEYVLAADVDITKFKNQGEAYKLIRGWVSPSLVFFSNLVSGLGLIAVLYHFYYLNENKKVLSVIYFFLSLNLPLVGLQGLSRASVVHFFLMYACVYIYIYPALDKSVRRNFNILISFIGGLIVFAFLLITYYRFAESNFYSIPDQSLIKNVVIYSIFDYFSQWISNGIIVLRGFSLNDLWFGKSSISLLDYALESAGFRMQSYVDLRFETLGDYGSRFNGLVATLVYDFSYVGVLFSLVVFYFFAKWVSIKPYINGYSIPLVAFMLSVPALFFSNNYLSNEIFSLSGLYAVMFVALSKIRLRKGR